MWTTWEEQWCLIVACAESFTEEWLKLVHWESYQNFQRNLRQSKTSVIQYAPPMDVRREAEPATTYYTTAQNRIREAEAANVTLPVCTVWRGGCEVDELLA